jgi:LysM repeat protein
MAIATSPKPLEERQLRLVFDADQPVTRVTTNVIPLRPSVVISPNHPAVAAKRNAAPVQLTVRGRRLVAFLALIPIVAAMVVFGGKVAQANSSAPAMTTVVVQPGQSLWDLASTVDPSQDPRAVILEIQQLNGLESADVSVGQQLIVPVN